MKARDKDQIISATELLTTNMLSKLRGLRSDGLIEENNPIHLLAHLVLAIDEHKWEQVVQYFDRYIQNISPLISKDVHTEFKSKCTALLLTDDFRQTIIKQVGEINAQLFFTLAQQLPLPTDDRPLPEKLLDLAIQAQHIPTILELGAQHTLPVEKIVSELKDNKEDKKPSIAVLLLKLVASIGKYGASPRARCDFENVVFKLSPTDDLELFRKNCNLLLTDRMFRACINKQVSSAKSEAFFKYMEDFQVRIGIPSRHFVSSEFKRSKLKPLSENDTYALWIGHLVFGCSMHMTASVRPEAKLIAEYSSGTNVRQQAAELLTVLKAYNAEGWLKKAIAASFQCMITDFLAVLEKTEEIIAQICQSGVTAEHLAFLKVVENKLDFNYRESSDSLAYEDKNFKRFIKLFPEFADSCRQNIPDAKLNQVYAHIRLIPAIASAIYQETTRRFQYSAIDSLTPLEIKTSPIKLKTAMEIAGIEFKELTFDGGNITNDVGGYKAKLTLPNLHRTLQLLENAPLLNIIHEFLAKYKTKEGELNLSWWTSNSLRNSIREAENLYQLILATAWYDRAQVDILMQELDKLEKNKQLGNSEFRKMLSNLCKMIAQEFGKQYKETSITQYTL